MSKLLIYGLIIVQSANPVVWHSDLVILEPASICYLEAQDGTASEVKQHTSSANLQCSIFSVLCT